MISVNPICATCKLFHVPKRGDLCWGCGRGTDKARRVELQAKDALDAHPRLNLYTSHDVRHPCAAQEGQRNVRPDFVWEFPDQVWVLEIDEHAHAYYEARCELVRLHELQALFAKPLRVLRFNPHAPEWRASGRKRSRDVVESDVFFVAPLLASLESLVLREPAKAPTYEEQGSEALKVYYVGYRDARLATLEHELEKMYESRV